MKYLKLFEEESNYQTFVDNGEMVLPNVSYIEESDRCAFNPIPKVTLNYNCSEDNSLAFSTGIDQIKKLTIDGENIDLTQIQAPYYFEAAGEHTVEVELLNNSFASMFGSGGNESLTSVSINRGVTMIGAYAFQNCTKLESVYIPNSVTSFGLYAFANCTSLASITIPNSVPFIGPCVFQGCTSLASITIPNSVINIGVAAFQGCTSLASITIPNSVTVIGNNAFAGCSSLASITCKATVAPNIFSATFQGVKMGGSLHYPAGSDYSSWLSTDSYFLGYYNWNKLMMVAKYNVTSTEAATKICYNTSSFSQMIVDGTTKTLATDYTFTTTGEHEVVFVLSGNTIGYSAFGNCSSLTSITIPDGVTEIGSTAFGNCSSLTSINIPDSVTFIGLGAFCDCSSLTSITIPDGVTEIINDTFENCYALTSITIPDSVTTIGMNAFFECSSLTSITIPDSVTTISAYAFQLCTSLKSITIPDSVTTIGQYAFGSCSSLTSVIINRGVTYIGESAFRSCSSLTSVIINRGDTYIGDYAFGGCSKLASITCNATVAPTITNTTFQGVKQYGSLYYPAGSDYSSWLSTNSYYLGYYKWNKAIVAKYNVTSTTSNTTICYDLSSFSQMIVDGTAKTLAKSYKFTTAGEHEVIFVLKGTAIETEAFYGCTSLTSITIPNGVTTIGQYAFYSCSKLESVYIPDSVTSIGENAFSDCSKLASITIPDSVTSIEDCAFDWCSSLVSVYIPNKVTSIGNYAFNQCTSLTSITIPDSVTSIGTYAFGSCSSLTSITIPSSVTSIGESVFYNCSKLASITCNATVAPTIDDYTFYNIKQCGSLYYPAGSDYSSWLSTSSYYLGYYNWNKAILVAKYDIITTTGNTTICYQTSSFSKIIVDGTAITPATGYTFSTTGEHEVVYVLSGTSIGSSAFQYCTRMTSIDIQNGVTTIGEAAFRYCSLLSSITIPNSVTSIGSEAFAYDNKLASITCNATVAPTITYTTFANGIKQYGSLYYPAGSDYSLWLSNVSYYLGYYKWNKAIVAKYNITSTEAETKICYHTSSFSQIIVDGTSIALATDYTFTTTGEHEVVYVLSGTTIATNAFRSCSALTSIIIPNGVTSVGPYAFYGCSSLASITIPDSVTSIGYYTFSGCTSLTSITIPNSITKIETYTFYDCTKLASITIPDGVTSIGASAFRGCSSLTSIIIPNGVTVIGNYVFYGCSKLTQIDIPYGVTTIGTYAFRSCSALTSITIPNSVTSIGNYAFANCSKLASITCLATVAPTVYTNTFQSIKKYGTLCVLIGSDYSSWLSANSYYLGYYKWNLRYI